MDGASDRPGRGQLILNHSHGSERKGEAVPQRQMGHYSQKRWDGDSQANPGDVLLQRSRESARVPEIRGCTPSASTHGICFSEPAIGEEARGPG